MQSNIFRIITGIEKERDVVAHVAWGLAPVAEETLVQSAEERRVI